jgi:hypothetical protein
MDQNLEDIDSLSLVRFAMGGPVGQMPAAQPIAFDGPLNMADGGLVDINSLSVAAFAKGGEAGEQYESLEDIMADAPSQDEEQKEWEQEIPVRDLTRQLNETVDKYRAGRASEADLRQFFPNYSDYDIANMFGMTDAGQSAPRAESLVQPFLNSQSYNRAVDRARMEDYQVERDIRQKSPNIYPYKRDFKLQLQELAEGGEVEERAYTEREVEQMRAAMAQSQADKEPKSPTQQAVKRIAPRATAQGPQQKSSLARQQLYALPPYPLDMTGKLGQAGPIKRAEGSPEYGEIAEQMTVGTPLPTDQGPSLASQGLNLLKQAGQTVYGNLREAVTDPVAFNKRALGNVAQQLQSDPQEFIMNWTGGGLGGIIRPKGGGNLLAGEVEKAIKPLRSGDVYSPELMSQLKKASDELIATGDPKKLQIAKNIQFDIEQKAPESALDDWIKNKFGNYIKKQMGTEDDPIRKLADEMSAKVQADYQAGLKRIAKMKDDIAKAKAKGKGTEASEAALADEIEKVEEAFQSTSILPIQLGPYTHVNASIGRAREKAGMSPFEIAKSNLGKSYEELADAPFAPTTKKEIDARIKTGETMGGSWAPDAPKLTENPWLAKLGEEDLVYRIRPLEINEKEIFTHTIDELRNALNPNSGLPPNLLLKPEDMQGLGIEKAFRHVNNINDWRAQQRVVASLADAERSATTIKEYPDTPKRLKWQQLKPAEYTELPPGYSVTSSYEGPALFGPDGKKLTTFSPYGDISVQQQALNFIAKNDLEKALKYEGSTMRHCVGGYCDDVWSGETNIFSLRDKKGEPHVTIETAPPEQLYPIGGEEFASLDAQTKAQYREHIRKWRKENPDIDELTEEHIVEALAEAGVPPNPPRILQIKGKGNAKPNEEYIPFVQDFIKSQQWSRIGDLQNTDLVPLKLTMSRSLEKKGVDINVAFTDDNLQPYVTKQEFNRLADLMGGVNKYD